MHMWEAAHTPLGLGCLYGHHGLLSLGLGSGLGEMLLEASLKDHEALGPQCPGMLQEGQSARDWSLQ